MRETFAEFKAKLEAERKNAERLKSEPTREWERVRSAAKGLNGAEGLDGHSFRWMNSTLELQDVCATFSAALPLTGRIRGYGIRFDRRPAGAGEMFEGDSPIAPETWSATPAINEDQFVWEIKDEKGALIAPPDLDSDEVADEVAKGLVQYLIKYEAANGRQW